MHKLTRIAVTIFGGWFGLHKYLDKKIGMGVLYTFTCGLFGIGWIVDIFKAIFSNINTVKPLIYEPSKIDSIQLTAQNDFDNMEGHEFEYYCADLLRKNGFYDVDVTKGSGDQGIDIIAFKDGIKYGIQCKCYSSDIGNKAVQEAFAGKTFYNCHVAAVLTNRYFTASAKELASKNGVLLWNRDELEKLSSTF